jgi:hypothetical protein
MTPTSGAHLSAADRGESGAGRERRVGRRRRFGPRERKRKEGGRGEVGLVGQKRVREKQKFSIFEKGSKHFNSNLNSTNSNLN